MSIKGMAREFKEKSGAEQTVNCFILRIKRLRTHIHSFKHIDTNTKVKLIFALSTSVDANFLEELREDALVEVDKKKRITNYKTNDGILELREDQSHSAMNRSAQLESKQSFRSLIRSYFENKNDAEAMPKNEKAKEIGNLFEFIIEKCENVKSPLNISQLAKDFTNRFGISIPSDTIETRIHTYRRDIQTLEILDTQTKVKQLFGLSAKLDSDFLKELRKNALVEVDEKNRITKYTANDNSLTLRGSHWGSGMRKPRSVKKTYKEKIVVATSDSSEEESDNERFNDSSDEYSSEEFDSEFDSDNNNDHLDETEDLTQPSEETDGFDIETPAGNCSEMSFDNNFDFDPPTEGSYRTEMIEVGDHNSGITGTAAFMTRKFPIETLAKSKTNSSTSHTPELSKRKADASGSNSSKRTKPPTEESLNPLRMDDNFSHDDPSRVNVKPFRGPLGLPNGNEKDSDIHQIPKPQVIEMPIKKEYEEETQTSLEMVLKAFKSLILSLDTPGLSHFQMEIDKKIMETGRGIEVSKKEVILAMDFLIIKLSKHGAPKSSEDSISLRDIFLMLRTIILNSNFNSLEVILEMLKENIDQLKVLDKRAPVSKVECVLRSTLNNINT